MSQPVAMASDPRRILIIKPSSLGDVVHALPVLPLLRRRYPKAHIAWLVAPYCAGLIEGRGDLDRVILFDRRYLGKAWFNPAAMASLWRLDQDLRRGHFDLVLDLQGLFRSGWLAWRTGARMRVGFANGREMAPLFYTHKVRIETDQIHAVDRYLRLAAAVGCESRPVEFSFPSSEEDRQSVRRLLGESGPYAVLLPGANWETKRWPAERFAELVRPLSARFGLRSIVAGGEDVKELARQIDGALDLSGKTNLRELVCLLKDAEVVVGNDSGPAHIAAGLGRPLVALFGPTDPVRTGPYGRPECVVQCHESCLGCRRRRCEHMRCLKKMHIEPVLRAIDRQLGRAPGAR